MTFSPSIPALLNIVVAGEGSFAGDAVNGINDLRCNRVLTTIGDLWIAAVAMGADVLNRLAGPIVCPAFSRKRAAWEDVRWDSKRNGFQDHGVRNL